MALLAVATLLLCLAPFHLNACPTAPGSGVSYTTIYSIPNGCEQSSCDYFLAARLNDADPTYLDFWLEGNAGGWIAVGFSATSSMANADVLACALDSSSTPVLIDAWNPAGYSNTRDTQQDLCSNVLEHDSGRFTCSFARAINTGDPNGQDLQLDSDLYLLLATRSTTGTSGNPPELQKHSSTPPRSPSALNVVSLVTPPAISPSVSSSEQPVPSTSSSSVPMATPMPPTPPLTCPPASPASESDYRVFARIPAGCERSSCTYYLAVRTNPDDPEFLDFELEGDAQSWIAIGLSKTASMRATDVSGCVVQADNSVAVVDAWNVDAPSYSNVRDKNQEICPKSSSFVNNRISCNFSRPIVSADTDEDLPMNDTYYLLFGRGNTPSTAQPPALNYHGPLTPVVSDSLVDITTATGEVGPPAEVGPDGCPSAPANSADYRLYSTIPSGCERAECSYVVAVRTNDQNSSFLDFYLEGDTSGWIAIGLSPSQSMLMADVFGCVVSSDGSTVSITDAWNFPSSRSNVRDTIQDVCPHSGFFQDDRIYCSFSRAIQTSDTDQDLDLSDDYFLLLATGNTPSDGGFLARHEVTPLIRPQVDITTAVGEITDTGPSSCPSAPSTDGDFLVASLPGGCTSDCSYTVRIKKNDQDPSFLDFFLEGETNGWIAVGLSETDDMFNADVFSCVVGTDGSTVSINDAWNPSSRSSNRDIMQDVCPHSSSFENGRISCIFSRAIQTADISEDLDLNSDLYLLLATGSTPSDSGSLARHDTTPPITEERVNPATFTGEVGASEVMVRPALTRIHGILMVVAWPVLAVTAIFFAAFMKPALPNGEWFQVHRAFNVASLIIGATAFFFIFVANYQTNGLISLTTSDDSVRIAHFSIGIFVMILHILNPLISICRCKPGTSNRWIFNLFHATLIGYAAEIFAFINAGIGLHLFGVNFSRFGNTLLWIFIAFVVFYDILIVVLLLVFFISGILAKNEKLAPSFLQSLAKSCSGGEQIEFSSEMKKVGEEKEDKQDLDPAPRKEPSKDSFLRWIGFGVFAAVMVPTMLAIIVLIIIPQ